MAARYVSPHNILTLMQRIEIDDNSGFCFGVVTAIRKAEEELAKSGTLYCLGDIVHNSDEVERLCAKGLVTITHEQLAELHDVKVLLRAHGEPPETYRMAERNNIEIIDATCPVVLRLQQRIKEAYDKDPESQIVIYGKKGHAEVNGLVGQTDGRAIVVEDSSQIDKIDINRDISLYSQTTKSLEGFNAMIQDINKMKGAGTTFDHYDTICRQVSTRVEKLTEFARRHDVVLFVAGAKSSNGKILYNGCKEVNPKTYLISNERQIDPQWFESTDSIGICGATSTPRWLMEKVREHVQEILK